MKIQNKVQGGTMIKWKELKDLQPSNLKVPYHIEKTKQSLIDLGFANAFDVWIDPQTEEMYLVDGHQRNNILKELITEGFEVPEELPCTFLDNKQIKTKKEAIKYLLRVFNIKQNPMQENVLIDWVRSEEIPVSHIVIETLTIEKEFEEKEEAIITFKFKDHAKHGAVKEKINELKKEKEFKTNEEVLEYLINN